MEKRIWKDVKGYNGKYQVSNDGLVKSTKRVAKILNYQGKESIRTVNERLMYIETSNKGYNKVELSDNGNRKKYFVHRLVYQSFVGDIPNDKFIDHIDTNKKNNNVDNLRLVTIKENNNNPLTLLHKRQSKAKV